MPLSKVGRSYVAIRREKGKKDATTFFPYTASPEDAVLWCESEGYKVLDHEIMETADDEKHIAFIVVTVEPKSKIEACPHCGKPGIVEDVDGQTYYSHKTTVEYGKETTHFGFTYCPEPSKRKTKTDK